MLNHILNSIANPDEYTATEEVYARRRRELSEWCRKVDRWKEYHASLPWYKRMFDKFDGNKTYA